MVGAFGEVQVMDWGLAKVLAEGSVADGCKSQQAETCAIQTVRSDGVGSESVAGSILGTPSYMAPEQARGEVDQLDERCDVFGLGAILCTILTEQPPYEGRTAEEIRSLAANGDLAPALARIENCEADFELLRLAKGCLSVDKRHRTRYRSLSTQTSRRTSGC